jgi:nitric oxide reductase large subunit
MNLSSSFVKYLGTQIQTRRRLIQIIFKIQGFNIAVSLQTNIPLQGKFASFINNPSALYSKITKSLVNSVNSGLFQNYLQAESQNLNITSFTNSTILSVQSNKYIIKVPNNKTYKNNKNNNRNIKSIIYVVIIITVILIFVKIIYDIQTKKKQIDFVKLETLNLKTSDIVISINENNNK